MTELDSLVAAVQASRRYRRLSAELVARVGAAELPKRSSLTDAIKATKSKLHQIAGSYLDREVAYGQWLDELRRARHTDNDDAYRMACRSIMRHQSSTRERLAILDEFYHEILGAIAPVRSILDLACGLNPLATPWMQLAENAEYWAYDVYSDMIDFLGDAIDIAGLRGGAVCGDITQLQAHPSVDLVLMLKCVPCLDRQDRQAAVRLLETLDAPHFLISFPVHSLGGRDRGMVQNYDARMAELVSGRSWQVSRFAYPTELAFLVSKS